MANSVPANEDAIVVEVAMTAHSTDMAAPDAAHVVAPLRTLPAGNHIIVASCPATTTCEVGEHMLPPIPLHVAAHATHDALIGTQFPHVDAVCTVPIEQTNDVDCPSCKITVVLMHDPAPTAVQVTTQSGIVVPLAVGVTERESEDEEDRERVGNGEKLCVGVVVMVYDGLALVVFVAEMVLLPVTPTEGLDDLVLLPTLADEDALPVALTERLDDPVSAGLADRVALPVPVRLSVPLRVRVSVAEPVDGMVTVGTGMQPRTMFAPFGRQVTP